MNESRADVVVVGCGPAGLVAAALLSRQGRRVIAVDAVVEPHDGALVLTEPAVSVLADVGWLAAVQALDGTVRMTGLSLAGPSEEIEVASAWTSLRVSRRLMVEELSRLALEDGVILRRGPSVTVPVWRDRRVAGVRYRDQDGRERTVEAAVVVDASGSAARIAAALGQLLPHRGGQRVRMSAAAARDVTGRHRLGIHDGQWLQLLAGAPGALTAVLSERDQEDGEPWDSLVARHAARFARLGWPEPAPPVVVSGRVGPTLRNVAGEGWVAVGEAAGSGSPGSPGTLATALGIASTAAWEVGLALQRGRPVGAGQLGATSTLVRRAVFVESLLDRALARTVKLGLLGDAVGSPRRRRVLAGLLAGDWRPRAGRVAQLLHLWWMDRRSRREVRRRG